MFSGLYLAESPIDSPFNIFAIVKIELAPFIVKAGAGNEKWVTLHPSKGNPDHYVHVKIRENPDGSAHVISGGKGLRGLRLSRLGTKEEIAQRKLKRDIERKNQKKADSELHQKKMKEDPLYADNYKAQQEQRKTKIDILQAKVNELSQKAAEQAKTLTNDQAYSWAGTTQEELDKINSDNKFREELAFMERLGLSLEDIADLPEDEKEEVEHSIRAQRAGASIVASRDVHAAKRAVSKLEKEIINSLVSDESLAQAVLMDKDFELEVPQKDPKRKLGYQSKAKEEAEQKGFDQEKAKEVKEDVRQDRLSKMNPKAAQMSEKMSRFAKDMNAAAKELKNEYSLERPEAKIDPEAIEEKAEHVRDFLKTQAELREVQRQLRAVQLGKDGTLEEQDALAQYDTAPEGAELGVSFGHADAAFLDSLKQTVNQAAQEKIVTQFLDSASSDDEFEDKPATAIRSAMAHHIAAGAHAHFMNAALAMTGSEGIDRMVVDTLGTDAAAQLTAHMLMRDLDPERLEEVKQGLGEYHEQESLTKMADATQEAQDLRAAALNVEIPPINGTVDAAVIEDQLKERQELLEGARERLGIALGEVEAGASLNLALSQGKRNGMEVDFGKRDTAQIATALHALGLHDDDYTLSRHPETNVLSAKLTASAMDKLSPQLDPERAKRNAKVKSILDGAEDEDDWLPEGFVSRPENTFQPGTEPPSLRGKPVFDSGTPVDSSLSQYAASLYADGMTPMQMYRELSSQAFLNHVPSSQHEDYQKALRELLPAAETLVKPTDKLKEQIKAEMSGGMFEPTPEQIEQAAQAKAEQIHGTDEAQGLTYAETKGVNLDEHPETISKLEKLSSDYLSEHFPDETAFHNQRINEGDDKTQEALFRVLAAKPHLAAAYADMSDVGGSKRGREHAKALREYYLKNVLEPTLQGVSAEEDAKNRKAEYQKALTDTDERFKKLNGGKLPEKFLSEDSGMMFGSSGDGVNLKFKAGTTEADHKAALEHLGLNEEHYTKSNDGYELNDKGKAAINVSKALKRDEEGAEAGPLDALAGGLEKVNPDFVAHHEETQRIHNQFAHGMGRWAEFVNHAGSLPRAYAAIQEKMKGELAQAFQDAHGQVTGKKLRISKAGTQHHRAILRATDEEALRALQQRDAEIDMKNRERQGGKFSDMGGRGSVSAKRDESLEQEGRDQTANQSALFSMFDAPPENKGGDTQAKDSGQLKPEADERYTLGHSVESSLKRMLDNSNYGIKPVDKPTDLLRNMTMAGEHVGKQRFIKALEQGKKLALFAGVGAGKTGMQIGGFTHLHAKGKVKKGIFAVPSTVQKQFGEEMLNFTKPGEYGWHSESAPFEERLRHYQNPDTHMVVMTHAAMRNDMLKMMANHHDMGVDDAQKQFEKSKPEERLKMMGDALKSHGIDPKTLYTAFDEGHNLTSDALQGQIAETLTKLSEYHVPATGSPLVNKPEEGYAWLSRLDPERFNNKYEFMRRYGANTEASREAFKRVMAQYSMVDKVDSGVDRKDIWGQEGPDGEHSPINLSPEQEEAYKGALDAYKRASRAHKSGKLDTEAIKTLSPGSFAGLPESEHEAQAAKLSKALGTLKHAALARVVNEHPAESNAKVKHALELVKGYKKDGKAGVIFAENQKSLDMLQEELGKAGHRVGRIDGRLSSEGKARVRNAFNRGEYDVLLGSRATDSGANFQKMGKYLVNYDIPYTQKSLEQRAGRIDRLGQKDDITVHHLVTNTSHDNLARKRIERKHRLGSSLQGEYESTDDYGIAQYLKMAEDERANKHFDLANAAD